MQNMLPKEISDIGAREDTEASHEENLILLHDMFGLQLRRVVKWWIK